MIEVQPADGTPKISDFGLARQMEQSAGLSLTGGPMGTPSYMSPEQARGDKAARGPAVDIYALGAILYELLTGRPPFHAESSSATLQQVITQEPVPPTRLNASVPRDLETICLKCLQKEPERRYVSAADLRDDVHRFLRGEPIVARPVSLAERLVRWARRKPAEAALGATVLTLVALALAGATSLELRRAERREETARQEEAVNAALRNSAALQEQGRWPEARAALAVPQLPDSAPKNVVERLRGAQKDADMVAELEEIRLRMPAFSSDDPTAPALVKLYADTFDKYGFPLLRLDVEEAASRLHASAIYETLMAFSHDWLSLALHENRAHLLDVLDRADNDVWRRAFRQALVQKNADKLNELSRASEAKDQPPVILSVLGNAMLIGQHRTAALALLQGAQQRHPGDFWINYLLGWFWSKERPREAVGFFRVAVAIRPESDQAHLMLVQALRDSDDPEGAIAALSESNALSPNFAVARDLITALVQTGRLEEARDAWENLLQHEPPNHEPWYGYAELCLFLGKTDEYRRARQALLEHFGTTASPFEAERTARACLLWPATEEELRRVAELAQRAVAVQEGDKWGEPYFEFVHGLAQYRQGQFDQAIATMRGDASTVLGPAPRLVLAMALHRSGQAADARDMLAKAILAHDWRAIQVPTLDPNGWIYNVLRREAESIILPNLHAFIDGKYQPQDNDERFALLGVCQFTNRSRAMARLYADAFAATPSLADDLGAGHLYNAARAAAQVGCGRGADATALEKEEMTQWRAQARRWLQADLAVRASALETGSLEIRGANRMALTRWQSEPDLAGLREPAELDKLAADERAECIALWAELAAVLARTRQ